MNWKKLYEEKLTTAEEAVKLIKSGDKVVLQHDVGEPTELVNAMIANHDAYENVEISHMFTLGSGEYCKPEYQNNFHPNIWFLSGQTRKAVNEGRGDYTPLFFHELPQLMRDGIVEVDVALIMVSSPDEHGFVSTGVSGDYTIQAIKSAKTVIAQVNENMPFTYGDGIFNISEFDAIVEANSELPALPAGKIGEVEAAIGKYCAELIEDGATLQLGIGSIPDAVCSELYTKKHLGLHSELLGDGAMKLYEAGVIDNSQKSLDKGKMVVNFIMGSKELYEFCDHNPAVSLMPVDYVNHPMVVAQCNNMVCINAAIGCDLYGQVAADTMGGDIQFSGVGGQVDFMRGAAMSHDHKGIAIIAMPSVTIKKDGTKISKITARLADGQVVTDTRHDTDYVITEYGIARLKGKTVKDRARALIDIAHPDFRDDLKASFKQMFKVEY